MSAMVQVGMKIAFIGDVMLGRLVNSVPSNDKFTYVWGDTLNVIQVRIYL